jgi:RNase H-fold protein (predicted Holliday junction resolvase)
MPLSKLSKCIIAPPRLATALKWNKQSGSIMGLEITKSRIAVAIAKHPSTQQDHHPCIHKFDPIAYRTNHEHGNRSTRKEYIFRELNKIAISERVCGFLVGWPLEPSGSPGSRCGQVLHLLDYFAERKQQHDGRGQCLINKSSRPVVLWDERNFTHKQFDDERTVQDNWGRCQQFADTQTHTYANTTQSSNSIPSSEPHIQTHTHALGTYKSSLGSNQPTSDDSTAACLLLEQFLKQNSQVLGMDPATNYQQGEDGYDFGVGIESEQGQFQQQRNTTEGNDFSQIIEHIESHGGICMKPSLL